MNAYILLFLWIFPAIFAGLYFSTVRTKPPADRFEYESILGRTVDRSFWAGGFWIATGAALLGTLFFFASIS